MSDCPMIIILFYLFIYLFLAPPGSMWDLSSLTRDRTRAPPPSLGAQSLNHWTARDVPALMLF